MPFKNYYQKWLYLSGLSELQLPPTSLSEAWRSLAHRNGESRCMQEATGWAVMMSPLKGTQGQAGDKAGRTLTHHQWTQTAFPLAMVAEAQEGL